MDINEHTKPANLERYSFIWSQVRLVIAAVALFLGGIPPAYFVLSSVPALFYLVRPILTICWIISGLAALYLLMIWNKNGLKIFGGKEKYDVWSFWVMIISGVNLGLAGLLSRNIGMSISSNHVIFIIVGVIYLASAWHLQNRWKANGQRLFS